MPHTTDDDAATSLVTLRDFIRYAVSRFNAAEIFYGHGTFDALEEAVFLVMEGLHLPLGPLDHWWDARLTAPERAKILGLITQRITTRKPAAYLVNKAYLHDLPFYVDERVIVPRSYIAELMAEGLSGVEDYPLVDDPESVTSVLDLCTGSGCLAILAAYTFPNAHIHAVELSPDAHAVARINIDNHGLEDRITLHQGDLFAPLQGLTFDLILTNPPYVGPAGMQNLPDEYTHEPAMALAGGGGDGLDIVRRILDHAPAHLNPGGGLLCEIGDAQDEMTDSRPDLPFLWLDTKHSTGEVFWLTREDIAGDAAP